MSNEEIHDFYVRRFAPKHSRADPTDPTHTVKAEVDEHQEVNRNVLLFWQKGRNDSMVRIPALCYLGNEEVKDIPDFFGAKYKIQSGCHVFINSEGRMESVQTCFDSAGSYLVNATVSRPISCVYPCYQNNRRRRAGRMLLGLKFERCSADSTGERTFGRQRDNQSGSGGAFDLIDKYLSKAELNGFATETFNPNPPEKTVLFGVYVCRGARLLVTDDRYQFSTAIGGGKAADKTHLPCHSLLQMGSLVVAEGGLRLEVPFCEVQESDDKDVYEERFGHEWSDAAKGEDNLLDPHLFNRDLEDFERIDRKFQLENANPLNQQKRFVVFIGSNESELNSSAWELSMSTQSEGKATQTRVTYSLLAPHNGRILDIQPWEVGFEQVVARHQYERLFESVLSPLRTPEFEFKKPDSETILKRILGIDRPVFEVTIPSKVGKPLKNMDKDVYRKIYPNDIELLDWCEKKEKNFSEPPPPPPLYPPIVGSKDDKLYYLQYGSHPVYDPHSKLFSIYGQNYKLADKVVDHYNWGYSEAIRPDDTNWQSFDQSCSRLANDYRIYKKNTDDYIGSAKISCFVRC